MSSFLTFDDEIELLTLKSTNDADIGQYEVQIMIFLENSPNASVTISKTQTMKVTVNPCQVISYTLVSPINTIEYTIGSGSYTSS